KVGGGLRLVEKEGFSEALPPPTDLLVLIVFYYGGAVDRTLEALCVTSGASGCPLATGRRPEPSRPISCRRADLFAGALTLMGVDQMPCEWPPSLSFNKIPTKESLLWLLPFTLRVIKVRETQHNLDRATEGAQSAALCELNFAASLQVSLHGRLVSKRHFGHKLSGALIVKINSDQSRRCAPSLSTSPPSFSLLSCLCAPSGLVCGERGDESCFGLSVPQLVSVSGAAGSSDSAGGAAGPSRVQPSACDTLSVTDPLRLEAQGRLAVVNGPKCSPVICSLICPLGARERSRGGGAYRCSRSLEGGCRGGDG
ncbi:hypothetical protein JOQ06_025795, partial [Pogonophryne albipinna]